MISNMLMVNDSKTEFFIVGSKQQLERVNIPFIHVGEDQITPVTSVRNLGVIFYSNLKVDMQITKACQIAYYHLHNIRRIRKFLSQDATCTIIHAFITSQIDYCNSLMNGLPENLIKKLQRVQNTAARLVFNLRKYDRITPALVTLHWLPVKYRIEFKTLLIVFKGLHGKAPTYTQEMITPSKSKRYSIRSIEERVLKVPKFKHDTFGKRAFAVYGPLAWNCLPKEIRLRDEIVNESTLAIWFWRIIVKRPRMSSAQFVALYKPCKPKPKPKPVRGISPRKGQWRGALMFSLICVWINGSVNNRGAGDLRRHRGHYDVNVMLYPPPCISWHAYISWHTQSCILAMHGRLIWWLSVSWNFMNKSYIFIWNKKKSGQRTNKCFGSSWN